MPTVVLFAGDGSSPRDSSAKCDACGRLGTVARAQRNTTPPATHRYCNDCWPSAKKRLVAEDEREQDAWRSEWRRSKKPFEQPDSAPPPPGWSWSSRSWADTIEFLEIVAAHSDAQLTADALSQLAAEIAESASDMEGAMPPIVRDFLQAHAPPRPDEKL